ncbi:MAG: GHKL domain-containing protein [Bacilli bacterium]|jgi:two-component system, LytTR family, sensor histidine kinase AgrC|uniref:GHKL domain-containing protein n=1 Tax=Anaerorhabdus sp. TaxID=1872524 RepID=UPI002FCB315E
MNIFDLFINIVESSTILFLATSLSTRKDKKIICPAFIYLMFSISFITIVNYYIGFEKYLFIIDILILLLYLSWIGKDSIFKKLTISILPFVLISNIYSLVIISSSYIFYGILDYSRLLSDWSKLITIVALAIFFILSVFIIKLFKSFENKLSTSEYIILFLLFLLIKAIFTSLETMIFSNTVNSNLLILSTYCLIVFTILICILFYRIGIRQDNYLRSIYENKILNDQISDFNNLVKSQSELLSIRHDLKHVLTLIDKNQINSLNDSLVSKLIDNYIYKVDKVFIPFTTSNLIVNNVLNVKYYEALNNDINIVSNINIVNDIEVDDDDFFLLLSNLLDNSLKHIGVDKTIYLTIKTFNKKLQISITNSFMESNELTHDALHGFGLTTIKRVVKKYSGDILIKNTDNSFEVFILI